MGDGIAKVRAIYEKLNAQRYLMRETVVFIDPITGNYEYRSACFYDAYDAKRWSKEMDDQYTKLKIVHSIYSDYLEREV